MKQLLILLGVFGILLFTSPVSLAQERLANCDLCGYCQGKEPPQNWESCRKCLYPAANTDPTTHGTLRVLPIDNNPVNPIYAPVTPQPGSQYTMVGCISTNTNSFSGVGAPGSVTQRLLTIIFSAAGGVAFLYLLYGAFLILTSQSDPERLNYGKRTVYGSIIGIVFILLSVFIVNTIGTTVLKLPGFGAP